MGSPSDDFALLLSDADRTTIALARGLLEAEGIPSLAQNVENLAARVLRLDLGEGTLALRERLFVPKSAHERAESLLREAWGAEAFDRHA